MLSCHARDRSSVAVGILRRYQGGVAAARSMMRDVAGEGGERATGKPRGSVGVPACPPAVDDAERPPQLVQQAVIRRRVGKVVKQLGEPGKAVAAGTALQGALFGEVGDDVCGVGEATLVDRDDMDDARAWARSERSE